MAPLEEIKSLPDASSFLKEGVTGDEHDQAVSCRVGVRVAKSLNRARGGLFLKVHDAPAAA